MKYGVFCCLSCGFFVYFTEMTAKPDWFVIYFTFWGKTTCWNFMSDFEKNLWLFCTPFRLVTYQCWQQCHGKSENFVFKYDAHKLPILIFWTFISVSYISWWSFFSRKSLGSVDDFASFCRSCFLYTRKLDLCIICN